jgi:hypothetical protein
MEQIVIETPITVFGKLVVDFPAGISKTFDELVQLLPGGFSRSFYGISTMAPGGIKYYATAVATYPGEGKQYGCEELVIDAGVYQALCVQDWRNKTGEIHAQFKLLHQAAGTNCESPAIEWYQDDETMLCMVKKAAQVL